MVSVSVCQAGHPGLRLAQFACFRKVEFYQGAVDLFQSVLTTGSKKTIHVLLCLCNNACKRVGHCVPLAGFCLSLYDLHALKQGR